MKGNMLLVTAVLALGWLTAGSPAAPAATRAASDQVVVVNGDQPVFWDGADVSAAVRSFEEGRAFFDGWSYELRVTKPAPLLRVGLDFKIDGVRDWADGRGPDSIGPVPGALALLPPRPVGFGALGARFWLDVIDPRGQTTTQGLFAGYSTEVFLPDATPGKYVVRVRPLGMEELATAMARHETRRHRLHFRLRAKREPASEPEPEGRLLPNLRIIAPFELGFSAPTFTYGPGAAASGAAAPSCMGEEYEEEALAAAYSAAAGESADPRVGIRCLRFSAGLENVGDGPLVVSGPAAPEPEWWNPRRPMDLPAEQRVLTVGSDGETAYEDRGAGELRYHPTHSHFHYEHAYAYTLYRLEGPDRKLVAKAPARKVGFNPADEKIARWAAFDQCPATGDDGGPAPCSATYADGKAVLGRGWGDVYEWNRSGQYVWFPADALGRPEDGDYVLVGRADPLGRLEETDESDNASYALLRARGGHVTLEERGYGEGPADRDKSVVTLVP